METAEKRVIPLAGKRSAQRQGRSVLARQEARWGFVFIGPWILGFILFTGLPILASFVLSFTDFNPLQPAETQFVGLDHYIRMFGDNLVWHSLKITLWFGLLSIPTGLVLTILVALLVNSERLLGKRLFRTLFYMPSMIPGVAAVLIWMGVLNAQSGWVNRMLAFIGIPGPDWITDPTWIYPTLMFMGFWGIGGGMIIMLAALQSVPSDLYDAAKVDGAGTVRRFRHITLPMISPVLFYQLTLSLIGLSHYFLQPYVLSNGTGRPDNATLFFNINVYREAFNYQQMGYASAQGWLMFVIVMLATIVLFATARYWVYYQGELS